METPYDIAIVGGGPGGYSAAIRAAQLGGRVILFEKENLGGTCLNVGCIPTKCLLEKAGLLDKIRKNTENGILKDAGLFSWKKIQEQKTAAVGKLVAGIEGILKSYQIHVVKGSARINQPGMVELLETGRQYTARKLLIATGSRTVMPKIKGMDGTQVMDSSQALNLKKIPISMVIIGGGVIGLEFASLYAAFGTKVTILEMLPELLGGEDRETVHGLQQELQKKGIRIITGARVEEIRDGNERKIVQYTRDNSTFHVEAECILAAVGRMANKEGIEVQKLGLELDAKGNIIVNRRLETNIPDIYAAGDVTGGYQLAHSAYAEAEAAAENCLGGKVEVSLDIMPRCIYTLPQFAAVGLTEEQAVERGISYDKGVFPYAANGKALASDETTGLIKVISHRDTQQVLGAHMMGAYATEMVVPVLTAMNLKASVKDFHKMIFPHPTLSEAVREAVLASAGMAVHLPDRRTS